MTVNVTESLFYLITPFYFDIYESHVPDRRQVSEKPTFSTEDLY